MDYMAGVCLTSLETVSFPIWFYHFTLFICLYIYLSPIVQLKENLILPLKTQIYGFPGKKNGEDLRTLDS